MSSRWSVSSAGRAPLSSAATRVAHPASETWVQLEVEPLELLQPSSRRRRRACSRRRRRHEGGEALVAERVATEAEIPPARAAAARPARGPPAPRRRWRRSQNEDLEPRQGASVQGGGERRGACVAHVHTDDVRDGSRPAARPRPAPPPAAARRRGRLSLSVRRGPAPRALAAPSPAWPASPGRLQ